MFVQLHCSIFLSLVLCVAQSAKLLNLYYCTILTLKLSTYLPCRDIKIYYFG